MMRMMFLARSPRLDNIFMDQEHNSMRNELGNKSWKYTLKGYISVNKMRKKKMKTILLNTYMRGKLIKMSLELLFLAWSLLELKNLERKMKNLEENLRAFSCFFLGVRPRWREERKNEMECSLNEDVRKI